MNKKIINYVKNFFWIDQEESVDKRLKFVHKLNHSLVHVEELFVVILIWFLSLMLASYSGVPGANEYSTHSEAVQDLQSAIQNLKTAPDVKRIIAQREVHTDVNNSAYPWYCTYMARVVTPEIFQYTSEHEQEHVFYGNAKDYCLNAKDAGLQIGNIPKKNSLIVYKPGNGYSSYGHVEKVIYVDKTVQKIITLGGNRVGRNIYSYYIDSYENNPSIDCFIYAPESNKNNVVPANVLKQIFPDATLVPEVIIENIEPEVIEEPLWEPIINITEEPKEITEKQEMGIVAPEIVIPTVIVPEQVDPSDIDLDFSNISAQAQHFLSQQNLEIQTNLNSKELYVWETESISINITKKWTNEKFSGILPVPISIIPTNNNLKLDYSYLQLINNGTAITNITATKKWETTLLLQLWWVTIAKIRVKISW